MSCVLRRSENIVWEELNGKAVLIHRATGERWMLNASAAAIWKQCNGQYGVMEIALSFTGNGKRALKQIKRDVHAFCVTLSAHGLLLSHEIRAEVLDCNRTPLATWTHPAIQCLGIGNLSRRRPSPKQWAWLRIKPPKASLESIHQAQAFPS